MNVAHASEHRRCARPSPYHPSVTVSLCLMLRCTQCEVRRQKWVIFPRSANELGPVNVTLFSGVPGCCSHGANVPRVAVPEHFPHSMAPTGSTSFILGTGAGERRCLLQGNAANERV